jgi:hypothetical protein
VDEVVGDGAVGGEAQVHQRQHREGPEAEGREGEVEGDAGEGGEERGDALEGVDVEEVVAEVG